MKFCGNTQCMIEIFQEYKFLNFGCSKFGKAVCLIGDLSSFTFMTRQNYRSS